MDYTSIQMTDYTSMQMMVSDTVASGDRNLHSGDLAAQSKNLPCQQIYTLYVWYADEFVGRCMDPRINPLDLPQCVSLFQFDTLPQPRS